MAHRQAWIEAARRLRLRCALAGDDIASHSERIAVQIGFTAADIRKFLPRWLAGEDAPTAVRTLLAPQTGSRTFQSLWQTCRAFQAGQITQEHLRLQFAENPWCLPQWIEPLIAALCPPRAKINASSHRAT